MLPRLARPTRAVNRGAGPVGPRCDLRVVEVALAGGRQAAFGSSVAPQPDDREVKLNPPAVQGRLAIPPANAWLLVDDGESHPTAAECRLGSRRLRARRLRGIRVLAELRTDLIPGRYVADEHEHDEDRERGADPVRREVVA